MGAEEYVESLPMWAKKKNTVQQVREFLGLLLEEGAPAEESPRIPIIHVAGTNGKGSVCAYLTQAFLDSGLHVGTFISPHLVDVKERILLDNVPVDGARFAEACEKVRALAERVCPTPEAETADTGKSENTGGPEDIGPAWPTYFEYLYYMAMCIFRDAKVDVIVLETGLGGRFDATNVISCPEAAVIMNIGLDHTGILGSTVEQIAFEKAGIIKPDCDCVLYDQPENVVNVIASACEERGARLHKADFSRIRSEFDSIDGQVFTYRGDAYAIPLLGANQLRNAAVVIDTVDVLRSRGWKIEQPDLEHGLYAVSWPARFEIISDDPFFVVDGGHNPQCAGSVAENLLRYFPDSRRIILTGVMRDKDSRGIFEALDPVADEYICVTPANSPRALPAEELAELLKEFGKKTTACADIKDGVAAALDAAGKDGMICATGSMYIAGPVRACFDLL